jgi:hypothetical protein
MMHGIIFPESPKNNSFKEFTEEEAISDIFHQNIEHMEIQDEISLDSLYFLKKSPKKDLIPEKSLEEQNQNKTQNDKPLIILDDYESFYSLFAEEKEMKDLDPERDSCRNPNFLVNIDYEKKLAFTPIEDEKILNIENLSPKIKNDSKKIVEIAQEKIEYKKEEKNKNKIDENIPKTNTKKRRHRNITPQKFISVNTKDKCFPFTTGKGINTLPKIFAESSPPGDPQKNYVNSQITQDSFSLSRQGFNPPNDPNGDAGSEIEFFKNEEKKGSNQGDKKEEYKDEKSNEEFSNYNEQINNLSENFLFKFTTKKYFVAPNGKKKRVKKKRKFKPDDIRKKIKARFHKTIKNIINENLKKAGSKELFDFLPQCFIGNVSKKTNSRCFELTYKELLSTNFLIELNKEDYRNSKVDQNKYLKNIRVLNYLEKNPEICKRSGFDLIQDRKYKDLLRIYFTSAQFENSLIQLKAEKESPEYIQEYIHRAKSYVSFYSNVKYTNDKKNETEEGKEDEDEVEKEEEEKDN